MEILFVGQAIGCKCKHFPYFIEPPKKKAKSSWPGAIFDQTYEWAMTPAKAQKGHGFAFILRSLKLVIDFQDSKIAERPY